jgi:hypothetical protein
MKDAFSLVVFTAAAICFAVFLTTFWSSGNLPEYGWNPSAPAAVQLSDLGCRLRGPLLADIRVRIAALSRSHDV